MNKIAFPLAVGEKTAAAMFDMSPKEFGELVSCGAFPPPKTFGSHERWALTDLEAILSGKASRPAEVFSL